MIAVRIALLQKEEERARKKIVETTEKASEVLQMREKNVSRLKQWDSLTSEDLKKKKQMQMKFKREEEDARVARSQKAQMVHEKRWQSAAEVKGEKERILKSVISERERELQLKQKKREEIRKQQEQARLRREQERLENERRAREYHEKLIAAEMEEASRAEQLVKELEKREQEWISRLRTTQSIQETAFEHLEAALLLDDNAAASPYLKAKDRSPSAPVNRSIASNDSKTRKIPAGSKSGK